MKHFNAVRLKGMSVLASAMVLLAGPVFAQHKMDEMGKTAPAMADCHQPMMKGLGKHLSQMKTKLHLSADQQTAWAAFANNMNAQPEAMGTVHDAGAMSKLTTPERLEKMNAMHESHMTAMQSHMKLRHDAVLKFYSQLSAEQQKTFDTESWAFHQHHMH